MTKRSCSVLFTQVSQHVFIFIIYAFSNSKLDFPMFLISLEFYYRHFFHKFAWDKSKIQCWNKLLIILLRALQPYNVEIKFSRLRKIHDLIMRNFCDGFHCIFILLNIFLTTSHINTNVFLSKANIVCICRHLKVAHLFFYSKETKIFKHNNLKDIVV